MNKRILISSLALFLFLGLNQNSWAKMSQQSNKLYNNAILQEQDGNYTQALNYIQKALIYSP